MPVRKRTALVDQRISRSSIKTDPRELLEQQHAMQMPSRPITPAPLMSRMSSAAALGLGAPLQRAPSKEPEQGASAEKSVNIIPPTPAVPIEDDGKVPDPPVPPFPDDDSISSPTASILESMELLDQPGNVDAPIASGASALKRASSGEVTRMRGPRGSSTANP